MGCQSTVSLGANLTFSICTHDADTGALTDTSAAPAYRIYEDETATAILTGIMTALDTVTTGFYTEQVACTTANGFDVDKSYTIYIEALVDGITGGIAYGFTVTSTVFKKNVALAKFSFVMRDSTTHAAASGLAVTATRSIDGASFAAGTLSAVTEIGTNGVYLVDFAAADLNGAVVVLKCTALAADTLYLTLVMTP
jgi:hypothetical protein